MKSAQRIRRVQLTTGKEDESALIGIVSAEPDYKLSLGINKKLKIALKSSEPVIPVIAENRQNSFSRFSDHSSMPGVTLELVSNRNGKNFLLRSLKNVDYIFRICDPENETDPGKIAGSLRNMEGITAIFSLDTGSLKDKNLQLILL